MSLLFFDIAVPSPRFDRRTGKSLSLTREASAWACPKGDLTLGDDEEPVDIEGLHDAWKVTT